MAPPSPQRPSPGSHRNVDRRQAAPRPPRRTPAGNRSTRTDPDVDRRDLRSGSGAGDAHRANASPNNLKHAQRKPAERSPTPRAPSQRKPVFRQSAQVSKRTSSVRTTSHPSKRRIRRNVHAAQARTVQRPLAFAIACRTARRPQLRDGPAAWSPRRKLAPRSNGGDRSLPCSSSASSWQFAGSGADDGDETADHDRRVRCRLMPATPIATAVTATPN